MENRIKHLVNDDIFKKSMIDIRGPGPRGSSTWSGSKSPHLATDKFAVEKAFTSCPLLGIPKSWRSMTRVTNNNNIQSGDNSSSDTLSMLPSLHRHPARMSPLTWHCLRGEPRCYWLPCSYPAAEGRARGSFSSHDSWSSIQIRSSSPPHQLVCKERWDC